MTPDYEIDLPVRNPVVRRLPERQVATRLTEKQVDTIIDIGGKIVVDLGEITKTIVDIYASRAKTQNAVETINSQTESFERRVKAEVEQMVTEMKCIETRGQVVVAVITAVTHALGMIPDVDTQSRCTLIETLPTLVQDSVRVR